MWWPWEQNDATMAAMAVGIFAALGVGIVALARRDVSWWRIGWRPWLGVALLAVAATTISLRADVRVYPDRIVATDVYGGQSIYPMGAVEQVEVWCTVMSRRRARDVPTLDYILQFPGDSISLRPAMNGRSGGAARDWFRKVEQLDRKVLTATPHVPEGLRQDMRCVQMLRAELGEADFAGARRMLGLTQGDVVRYYSEPHEAWNGHTDNGR